MPLDLFLKDPYYEFKGVTHTREISRAFVLDDRLRIAIHRLHRNDIFGDQEYYETPGGGIDEGESKEEAVIRECEEEIGYRIGILSYLGRVKDYYNLIGRENINHFFLAKRKEYLGKHFESAGDSFIQETLYYPIDTLIDLYRKQDDSGVAGIVKRRELPFLLEVQKILKSLQ